MKRISVALAGLALLVQAAQAQTTAPADPGNTLYLDLDYGRVVIRMRPDLAPKHVERIKHLVRGGFYDGMVFHRVLDNFVAQTGDPTGTGTSGSGRKLDPEFTRTAQMRGVVSMARGSGKNSADSQWFIVLADNRDALDGKYTVWGEVTEGMSFVDKIRKGDSNRNGTVKTPDRVVRLQIAADADRPVQAIADFSDAATVRNFSAVEFRCLALNNRPGSEAQAALAKVWSHGYLAGVAKAKEQLSFAADGSANNAVDSALAEVCGAKPETFLLVGAQSWTKSPRALPGSTQAFSPASYTCKDYTAARAAKTTEADAVDVWALALIQGFKNVGQPDMEIPFDAKPQLLGPVASVCAKSPELLFADVASLVASKVKLK